MQAVAFETEIENDIIRIPKEYSEKIPYRAMITIVYGDTSNNSEKEKLKRKAAYERLKKYKGVIDRDIDYKYELKQALDEKYGGVD
jgi:hypothetical protein